MATQIGSGTGTLATYIPDLADAANIQTALKQLYYGTTGGTLSTSTGIYGALYTLYSGSPTIGDPAGTVTIAGDLIVSGNTTTINTSTLDVEDAEISLGKVASPTDTTANQGGIRLKGASDKTITWDSANSNWTSSEHFNLANGKTLRLNGGASSQVISGTASALVLGGNASTTIAIGANGGTATILNPTVTLTNATVLNVNGASPSISTTSTGTASVFNTNALTVNVGNAATTASIANSATTLNIGNTATAAQTVNMFTASTGASTYNFATGANNLNTKTINIGTGGSPTSTTNINLGVSAGGTVTVNGNLTLATAGKQILLPNGTTAVAPLKFTGTTTTSFGNWAAGNVEYSGQGFVVTTAQNGGPATIAAPYYAYLTSPVSLSTSTTNAMGQNITLAAGLYEFEINLIFQYTYVAPTSSTLTLGLKGSAITDDVNFLEEYSTRAATFADNASYTTTASTWRRSTTTQSLTTSNLVKSMGTAASGSISGIYRAKGVFNITTSGNVFASAGFTGTGSGSVLEGSFMKVTPLGTYSGYWASST